MQDVVRLLRSHAPDTDGGRAAEKADGGPVPPNEDRCLKILRGLFDLEQRLDSIQLAAISHMGSSVGKVFPGQWLLGVMEQSGFSFEEVSI